MARETPLETVPLGTTVVLGPGGASEQACRRLVTLGLRPGVAFRVLARTVGGGRVAQVGETRIALGASLCRELRVEVPSA